MSIRLHDNAFLSNRMKICCNLNPRNYATHFDILIAVLIEPHWSLPIKKTLVGVPGSLTVWSHLTKNMAIGNVCRSDQSSPRIVTKLTFQKLPRSNPWLQVPLPYCQSVTLNYRKCFPCSQSFQVCQYLPESTTELWTKINRYVTLATSDRYSFCSHK